MQTVYEDPQFRIVSRTQVGDCDTVIHNWTIEQRCGAQWQHCGREFSKFSAVEMLRKIKLRLH